MLGYHAIDHCLNHIRQSIDKDSWLVDQSMLHGIIDPILEVVKLQLLIIAILTKILSDNILKSVTFIAWATRSTFITFILSPWDELEPTSSAATTFNLYFWMTVPWRVSVKEFMNWSFTLLIICSSSCLCSAVSLSNVTGTMLPGSTSVDVVLAPIWVAGGLTPVPGDGGGFSNIWLIIRRWSH